MRHIDKIVVHCAATRPSMDIGVEEIRQWHTEGNGWSDIGYHYVIRRNGLVEDGRDESSAGAHAKGHNASSLGICLVGGMSEDMARSDANFTLAQYISLAQLVHQLKERYDITSVKGHRDLSTKACPSFDVAALLS